MVYKVELFPQPLGEAIRMLRVEFVLMEVTGSRILDYLRE